MGHILTADSIQPDPAKVEAIQKMPVPTTIKQLHSFLGMVGVYSPYIPNLADLSEPLNALRRDNATTFTWTDECGTAFNKLKETIRSHLQLALFDPRCLTHVNVDASDTGLGATLTQDQGGWR